MHALPLLIERVSTKAAPRIANLMVSNPFGFEGQQYLMGADVQLVLPLSVLAAGYKLNVTAVTVHDRLQIDCRSAADRLPGHAAGRARHRQAGARHRTRFRKDESRARAGAAAARRGHSGGKRPNAERAP